MRTLQLVWGVLAVLLGVFFLLFTFAFSTLVDPELQGLAWWRAVFGMMYRAGLMGLVIGFGSLIGGTWLILLARGSTTPRL